MEQLEGDKGKREERMWPGAKISHQSPIHLIKTLSPGTYHCTPQTREGGRRVSREKSSQQVFCQNDTCFPVCDFLMATAALWCLSVKN